MELALILIGIALSLSAQAVYIRQIISRGIRPSLSAFMVFALSTGLAGAASLQFSQGFEALIHLSFAFIHFLMLLIAFKLNQHAGWERLDNLWIGLAVVSACSWVLLDNPIYALASAVLIDLIGFIALIRKQFKVPAQEALYPWAAAGGAYLLSFSTPFWVGTEFSFEALIFSGMNVIGCFLVMAIDCIQKMKRRQAAFT